MIKKWKIQFPSSTIIEAETPKEAFEEAIKELNRFWVLCCLLGGKPIQEIKK
ncbi:hypothetical protein ES705_35597 [subsurface metagenome]